MNWLVRRIFEAEVCTCNTLLIDFTQPFCKIRTPPASHEFSHAKTPYAVTLVNRHIHDMPEVQRFGFQFLPDAKEHTKNGQF